MSCLGGFLGLDRDFSDVSRQNRDFSISIEISQLSRLTFWNCRDFLDRRDWLFSVSRSRVSIETTSRQIETPNLKATIAVIITHYFFLMIHNLLLFRWNYKSRRFHILSQLWVAVQGPDVGAADSAETGSDGDHQQPTDHQRTLAPRRIIRKRNQPDRTTR